MPVLRAHVCNDFSCLVPSLAGNAEQQNLECWRVADLFWSPAFSWVVAVFQSRWFLLKAASDQSDEAFCIGAAFICVWLNIEQKAPPCSCASLTLL